MRAALLFALAFTTTAQAQWTLQDSRTTADLRGIDNVGGGVAWASGTNGTVLRTEDAGFVWQHCTIPPGAEHLDFRGIQAFDNNTAIVMSSGPGDQSRLYKTTDGCQSWKLVFTNPDKEGFWDAIQFDTRRTGMLIGDPVHASFPIFSTTNAGDTWSKVDHLDTHVAKIISGKSTEAMFAASNSTFLLRKNPEPHAWLEILFLTGGSESLIHRIDVFDQPIPLIKGTTMFNNIPSLLPTGETAGGFSFALREEKDSTTLIPVGGDYKEPDSSTQTASRCVWIPDALSSHFKCESSQTPPHGYRSSVAYDPKSKTWLTVGPNGTDISTDDGRNWHPLRPNPAFPDTQPDEDQHWNALSLPFVVGPHGRIATLRRSVLTPTASNP
jgi:hypothetical protein